MKDEGIAPRNEVAQRVSRQNWHEYQGIFHPLVGSERHCKCNPAICPVAQLRFDRPHPGNYSMNSRVRVVEAFI